MDFSSNSLPSVSPAGSISSQVESVPAGPISGSRPSTPPASSISGPDPNSLSCENPPQRASADESKGKSDSTPHENTPKEHSAEGAQGISIPHENASKTASSVEAQGNSIPHENSISHETSIPHGIAPSNASTVEAQGSSEPKNASTEEETTANVSSDEKPHKSATSEVMPSSDSQPAVHCERKSSSAETTAVVRQSFRDVLLGDPVQVRNKLLPFETNCPIDRSSKGTRGGQGTSKSW